MSKKLYVLCDNSNTEGKIYIADDFSNTGDISSAKHYENPKEVQNIIDDSNLDWGYVDCFEVDNNTTI